MDRMETSGADGEEAFPLRLRGRIGELRLNEDQFFRDISGRVLQDRDGALNVWLEGALRGGSPVRFTLDRTADGGEMRLRADDAGQFLRDAGICDDGSGGDLLIRGDLPPGGSFDVDGRLLVRDIVIHDDAKLEGLLSGAELSELQSTMREDGLVFSSIRAPFVYRDDKVRLTKAVAKSASIGVSGSKGSAAPGVAIPVHVPVSS